MKRLIKRLTACIPFILMLTALATISLSLSGGMDQEMSEHNKMMYGFAAKAGGNLAQKYKLTLAGTGGGADKDGIWLMSPSFDRSGGEPLTEEEARKLIISCVDDFLEAVNSDEQLKPFLKNYPFTAKNLDLDIFNYDKERNLHLFPHIAIVANSQGEISFLTKDPSTQYGYHTEKYETYDEAVAILNHENKK